jgi:hypothetical protein
MHWINLTYTSQYVVCNAAQKRPKFKIQSTGPTERIQLLHHPEEKSKVEP